MRKRVFWMIQGGMIAAITIAGLASLNETAWPDTPPWMHPLTFVCWTMTAVMTAFNTARFIYVHYEEPV
jgi:hypothetical protein